ncbi:hypothetical protein HOLleu_27157 [Holothuria leucospilota]|uniref:Uncharacterized protein n=1 Tax=Holothuria leucospilota TaxID=206669 RepID=A0A9Q1BQC3_HOLLE|nr:hypothetical protein HOLleu_27157 [Holothuria leucospilota]
MVGNLPMEPSGYEVPITMNDETQVQPEPEGKNAVKLLRAKRLKVLLLKYNKDILPRKLYKQLKSPIAKKSVNAVGIYACLR